MQKSIVTSALLFGALSLTGLAVQPASAVNATIALNIDGSSAQFALWNEVSGNYLTSLGCTGITAAVDSSNTYGVTFATACSDGSPRTIRYTSKASYDGIYALTGAIYPNDPTPAGLNGQTCTGGTRAFADETTLNGSGAVVNTICRQVDLAASDVAFQDFLQSSPATTAGVLGQLNTIPARSFSASTVPGNSGWTKYTPMVVPFGFFVHTDVVVTRCVGGTNPGAECNANDTGSISPNPECQGGGTCQSTAATATPLSNITRMMAVSIFTGQANNWLDFGTGYQFAGAANSNTITVCIRAAGSGSLATLDEGIIRANGWNGGAHLLSGINQGGATTVWTDGTGAEMTCVNTISGAIGFADADRALGMAPLYNSANPPFAISHYASTMPLTYNGEAPTRVNIRNGIYDNFWTVEQLYQLPADNGTPVGTLAAGLTAAAGNPASLSVTDRANYWASVDEMYQMKTSDLTYPANAVVPPSDPQNP